MQLAENASNCYDPTVITTPKTFHIQSIYSLLGLQDFSRFRRPPDLLRSLASEIILPQRLLEDMEIISAVFAGSVIRERFGKLSTQSSPEEKPKII
jgi:hypothetical protein